MDRRIPLLTPTLVGLFVTRLLAELSGQLLTVFAIASLVIVSVGVAFVVWQRFNHAQHIPWWVALLTIYVLWPEFAPHLGCGIAVVVVLIHLMRIGPLSGRWDGLIFVVAAIVYIVTLAPGVLPADSGEFQKVNALLGVAHPPGYPLYTVVSSLVNLLPINSPAWRTNLVSALTASVTLGLVGLTVRRLSQAKGENTGWGSLIAAMSLGAVPTFWSVATTASVRPLTSMFAAAYVATVISFWSAQREGKTGDRHLALFGLLLSLGLGHHPSLLFVALLASLSIVFSAPRILRQPRRWVTPALFLLAGLLVQLYLPMRGAAGAIGAPADLVTLDGFLNVILARGFGDHFFSFHEADIVLARLQIMLDILRYQFGDVLLVAALVGIVVVSRRHKAISWMLVGGAILHIFITATFGSPQIAEYLIPAYVLLAILMGYAVNALLSVKVSAPLTAVSRVAAAGVAIFALILANQSFSNGRWLATTGGLDTQRYISTILKDAPSNAIVLANWHWYTPLDYAIKVEGQRHDLDVQYVFPEGTETPVQTWLRRVDKAIATGRPVIVTWIFPQEYAASLYRFEPIGEALLVNNTPRKTTPIGLSTPKQSYLTVDRWQLLGYYLPERTITAGSDFAVTVAWQAKSALDIDTAFFVHLLGADGIPVGQYDLHHPSSRVQSGDVVYDRYPLAVPPGLAPGIYRLVAGAYTVTPDGKTNPLKAVDGTTSIQLDELEVIADTLPIASQHPLQVRFAGCPTLIGIDHDFSIAGVQRVFLHWQGNSEATLSCGVQLSRGTAVVGSAQISSLSVESRQTIRVDVPPSSDLLTLSVLSSNGQRVPRQFAWSLALDIPLAMPIAHPQDRYVPLGGGITLVGADQLAVVQGQNLSYTLRFMARRPLLRDDQLSLRFTAPTWMEPIAQDTPPALGALPTLKWVYGPIITDRHFMRIVGDTSSSGIKAQVILYDLFTQQSLPILDPQLAQNGPFLVLNP